MKKIVTLNRKESIEPVEIHVEQELESYEKKLICFDLISVYNIRETNRQSFETHCASRLSIEPKKNDIKFFERPDFLLLLLRSI